MGRIEQNTDMANVADTAVVTGSSSGIGLALSRMLVKMGMKFLVLEEILKEQKHRSFAKNSRKNFMRWSVTLRTRRHCVRILKRLIRITVSRCWSIMRGSVITVCMKN